MGAALGDKWPRRYAAEIMAEPNKDKRREMFERCPEDLKELIWAHCVNAARGRGNARN